MRKGKINELGKIFFFFKFKKHLSCPQYEIGIIERGVQLCANSAGCNSKWKGVFHKTNAVLRRCPRSCTPSSLTLQDLESCRLRLDPELDRHRYERKISFAGVLDENEDSKDSLHSSSHTLKSDAGAEEKKGMEKQEFFSCFSVSHRIFGLGSTL